MKKKYNPETTELKLNNEALALLEICENTFHCDLQSKSRKINYVYARMAFSSLLRKRGYGFSKVGSFIDRDHATIIHYEKNLEVYLNTDVVFKNRYGIVKEGFEAICTKNKLKVTANFIEKKDKENYYLSLPHYNKELINHINFLNKQKKDLHLTIEQMQLKIDALNQSENRVKTLIDIVSQRTRIGTEQDVEKKLHIWYNGVYEK